MTQSEYSFLLGWGEITVTRYETKTIQDETYDNIIRLSYENPLFALDKHIDKFLPSRYNSIKKDLIDRIDKNHNLYFIEKQIKSKYISFSEPNEFNGNCLININKIADLLSYFAASMSNLYKVKLMKLLWYSDVIFYAKHNTSITGLVYNHMPLALCVN